MLFRFLFLLGVLSALAGMGYARPDCSDCQEETAAVKVTLVVILASEQGDTIDPKLKAIAEEVQKMNPKLKSFKIGSMQSKSLKPGEKVSLNCVENKKVDLLIKHGANKDNRISLSIFPPNLGEIEYQTVCGKFLPIVTRCTTKEGERLILAIRVQPCRGD